MDEYVPMTRDGFNKLKAEVEQMDRVQMPAIAEKSLTPIRLSQSKPEDPG